MRTRYDSGSVALDAALASLAADGKVENVDFHLWVNGVDTWIFTGVDENA